jgi:hypothetical protein
VPRNAARSDRTINGIELRSGFRTRGSDPIARRANRGRVAGQEDMVKRQLRGRFWVETGMAALSLALLVLTLVWDEWIEILFGVNPDGGSGELEWVLAGAMLIVTGAFLVLARIEWRRAVVQPA